MTARGFEFASPLASDLAGVTAVVLAGGLGTRLRSIVHDRQKTIADVGGRPFLALLLERLEAAGVKDAVLCTGYQNDQVRAALGDRQGEIRLQYSVEASPLGTAGALRHALPLVSTPEVLALNGDSVVGADFGELRRQHRGREARITMLLVAVPDRTRFGTVSINERQEVIGFHEKGPTGPGLVNAGVYLLERTTLTDIRLGKVSMEHDVLPAFVRRGLYGVVTPGPFIDIGTPESYAEAQVVLSRQRAPGATRP